MVEQSHFDAWIGLTGAIIGAGIVLMATYFAHHLKQMAEKRRMASAFAGEITAVMEIARLRRVKEVLESGLIVYRTNQHWESWTWPISDDYFRVYRQNVDKIGLFEAPVPEKISCFYTFCFAIVENLSAMEKMNLKDSDAMIYSMTQDLEILNKIEGLGEELKQILNGVSK